MERRQLLAGTAAGLLLTPATFGEAAGSSEQTATVTGYIPYGAPD